MVSVISWGIAEVPQIITTYREKSVKGFSVAFLMAWIIGDIFNLVGCLLEPATLKTQFYMALLYTATTAILTAQIVYYGHLCHRLEADKACKPEKAHVLQTFNIHAHPCRTSSEMPLLTEDGDSSLVPLLGSLSSSHAAKPLGIKNRRCVVSSAAFFFVGLYVLQLPVNDVFDTNPQGLVIPVGRKLLQD